MRTLILTVGGVEDCELFYPCYRFQEVVMDGNLITSHYPPDLPAFCRQIRAAIHQTV